MKISDISIRKPVFATMMIASLLVLGLFSYYALPVEMFPNVDFPFVIVQTVYPGASAESVETEVSKTIEDVINEISGVKTIQTTSREGLSTVVVEFELEVDGTVAAQDVREKVATIRQDLPDDIEEPLVIQYDQDAEAVMSIAISGQRPLREITDIVKNKIKTRLEIIPGVGNVQLIGGFEREILVAVDPDKMESYEVTVNDIQNAVAAANMEIPGGRVDESDREYLVRIKGRLDRVEEFNNIIVKNKNGTPVYLSNVAAVKDTIAEQRSLSRFEGKTAVSLNIIKQSGANIVEMAKRCTKTVEELKDELPPDINIVIVNDNSVFIQDSIHEIIFNIQFGTLLAVFVIFLFLLDIKPTIITGLSIPISIVATFTLMNALGFTINFMTLLGLSLAVGILIDDAIVVVENIYRHLDMGKPAAKAAFDATKEIGLAVMATTFTIMVVFLPVAFMSDLVGRFFYQFGVTVAFSVLVSLFVAFTLTPMLSSQWLKTKVDKVKDKAKAPSGLSASWTNFKRLLGIWNKVFDRLVPVYKALLQGSLNHRWVVVVLATLIFIGSMFLATTLPQEWFEESDMNKMFITVETPPGTTLDETSSRMEAIENIVTALPEVNSAFVTIGQGSGSVTDGYMLCLLTDASTREIGAKALTDSVRILLQAIPGIKYSISMSQPEGGSSKPVEFSIRGEDRDELTRLARRVQAILTAIPGAIDVDNSMQEGKPEIQLEIDRRAADDLGLSLMTIPMTVRYLIEGEVVTRFKDGDEEYDVRVKLADKYKNSSQAVGRIMIESDKFVPGTDPFLVPLNRVAKIEKKTEIGEYHRRNRQNEIMINSNALNGYASGTISLQLMNEIADIQLPPGYSIGPVGQEEMRQESNINIMIALLQAIIFIYILLASQYESFTDPLSIMLSLPLSLIGAFLGLKIFGSSMSIMAMIGIVMLMGLVTKNAILLIDFVKQQREKGVPLFEAVLIAGPIRLRPILMTTFATVFGMLPLALGIGPGAEMRAPMARAAIGGVISSTLLTLVVVPVVYTIIVDLVNFTKRLFGAKTDEIKKSIEDMPLDEQLDSPQ